MKSAVLFIIMSLLPILAPAQHIDGIQKDSVVSLQSTTNYFAFDANASQVLEISDPLILELKRRFYGADVKISGSGVVGMPNGTYGFADGQLFLRSTTATSPGTLYGSAATGTGTTLGGLGSGEYFLGVNGRAAAAGPWMWGSKPYWYPLPKDSVIKRMGRLLYPLR